MTQSLARSLTESFHPIGLASLDLVIVLNFFESTYLKGKYNLILNI